MSFNLDNLEPFSQDAAREIATKAVAEAKTASLLIAAGAVTAGVKGTATIRTMDTEVHLQENDGCGRNPVGQTTLGDMKIVVTPITDQQNFCFKDVYGTWFSQKLAKGQNPETEVMDSSFQSDIMNLRASKIAAATEQLLWRGDTAIVGTSNLNQIDGFLKQLDGNTELVATGADLIAKLQSLYKQYDVTVRSQEDFYIFIGQDLHDEYLIELENANKFRPGAEDILSGTRAKFAVVPGLNKEGAETTSKVIGARIKSLHLGIDGTDDSHKAAFRYSEETTQFYADIYFSVGVKVIFPDQVYVATI